ncbi:hypothetical protein GCM10022200_01640 [Microbacterium awajiense]|uniref:DUF2510 domain-containing protein n=1 Tax=Microbacterium awajiense TaxID=415214 RepID=A0ABP7A178_9MICO
MADTSPPSAPPPGWYAESARAQRLRWWSGSEWTNHYQLVVQARALQPPPPDELGTPLDQDVEDDADLLATPRSAAQPGPQPATERPPLTRAERAARERAGAVATQMTPIVAVPTATRADAAGPASGPAPAEFASTDAATKPDPTVQGPPTATRVFPEGAAQPTEAPERPARRDPGYPDQITTPDRPVRPLVYAPHSSRYTGDQPAVIADPVAGNGLASTAIALIFASAVCGVVAYFIRPSSETVASVSWTLAAALVVAAFILAVAGMAVAVQRPTRKGWALAALVVSSLLLLALIGLLALPLFASAG